MRIALPSPSENLCLKTDWVLSPHLFYFPCYTRLIGGLRTTKVVILFYTSSWDKISQQDHRFIGSMVSSESLSSPSLSSVSSVSSVSSLDSSTPTSASDGISFSLNLDPFKIDCLHLNILQTAMFSLRRSDADGILFSRSVAKRNEKHRCCYPRTTLLTLHCCFPFLLKCTGLLCVCLFLCTYI